MKYYKVLMSDEYSKSGGKYGIVDVFPNVNDEYLLEDGLRFPKEILNDVTFVFEGTKDDSELGDNLADYQMMYYPWRLISKKLYLILEEFSKEDIFYFPIGVKKNNTRFDYFLMHFNNTLKITKEKANKLLSYNFKEKDSKDIFCFKNNLSDCFIVSEIVKQKIEKNNITGLSFETID